MQKLSKNDKISIIATNDFWEGKHGIVFKEPLDESNKESDIMVKVNLNGKNVIQTFPRRCIKSEALLEKYESDIIHNYVYAEDLNFENIPSWFFAEKIAAAENMSVNDILKLAKTNGYKIYRISADNFSKLIVAAPDCTIDKIFDDYADYLKGDVKIQEVA